MADGRFIFFWSFLGVWLISRFPYGQAAEVLIGVELAPLQHLVINNGEEIATLDPHQLYGVPAKNVMRNLFEGLVNLDSCGQVAPGVAERWQQSADGKTWTFYLRPNARWSNGDPLTADDFIYSWRRLAAPSTRSPYSHYLIDLGLVNGAAVIAGQQPPKTLGVRAIDQQTLQLQCERIVPYCLKLLTVVAFYPVHAATVEQYGNGVDDHRWYCGLSFRR
ncbi:MAG: ABC transporter substrate-binding protein [Candidatus Symbiodolus clandestinus]